MKLKPLALVLFYGMIGTAVFGQSDQAKCQREFDTLTSRWLYAKADPMPQPEGGQEVLIDLLKQMKLDGSFCGLLNEKMTITFVVESDGSLTHQRILGETAHSEVGRQVFTGLNNIAWSAGKCQGEAVAVRYFIPIYIHAR